MKIENSIGWCDETTNAATGCDKVSPGCKNCYAQVGTRARVLRAQGIETWGPKGVRHPVAQFATKIRRLNKLCVCGVCHTGYPVKRLTSNFKTCHALGEETAIGNRLPCGGDLRRVRLFADSNSDWLDEKWELATLANALNEIRLAPNVDVLLLTKRIGDFFSRLEAMLKWIEANDCKDAEGNSSLGLRDWLADWILLKKAPPQVWLGVSVENQPMADLRIPQLLAIPAAVRFLSCEPLLEATNLFNDIGGTLWIGANRGCNGMHHGRGTPECPKELHHHHDNRCKPGVDWVIVGGESGKDRRDCGEESIISIAHECQEAGVPVYVKQDCAFKSGEQGRIPAGVWGLKQFPARAERAI